MANKIDIALTNFIKATRAIAAGRTEFEHGPSHLEFAWTSACNLRCRMCSQSDNPPVVKVSKEKAAPFLERVLPTSTFWNPSATSEPLLNDVDEMVRLCSEHHVFLHLFTNAVLLKPETLEKIAPWINKLSLSIDSHVPEVLEQVRYPVKFEKVLPNVENAVRRCKELSIPCIFNTALMTATVVHYPDFVDWVADLGGTDIEVLHLIYASTGAPEMDAVKHLGLERVKGLLAEMRSRAAARGVSLHFLLPEDLDGGLHPTASQVPRMTLATVVDHLQTLHELETAGYCPHVGYYLKVGPKGDAYPCCRAPAELYLGNVFEEDFDAVWNGEAAQSLRAAHRDGKVPEVCKGCMIREVPMAEAARQKGRLAP